MNIFDSQYPVNPTHSALARPRTAQSEHIFPRHEPQPVGVRVVTIPPIVPLVTILLPPPPHDGRPPLIPPGIRLPMRKND